MARRSLTLLQIAKLIGDCEIGMDNVDLSECDLSGRTVLDAALWWHGASYREHEKYGTNICLADANLARSDLRCASLRYANLSRADLSGADLSGADLHFTWLEGATLVGCRIDTLAISTSLFSISWWIDRGAVVVG